MASPPAERPRTRATGRTQEGSQDPGIALEAPTPTASGSQVILEPPAPETVTLPKDIYDQLLLRIQHGERSPKERTHKAPPYCVKKLTREATQVEVVDWVEGIKDGNLTLPEATPEPLKILWALNRTENELQTLWRQYAKGLPGPPTIENLFTFIQRDHQFPEIQEQKLRRVLSELRQKGKTPDELRGEWYSLQARLGEAPGDEENSKVAWDFFSRLNKRLQEKLEETATPLTHYKKVCAEASRQWALIIRAEEKQAHQKRKTTSNSDEHSAKRPRWNSSRTPSEPKRNDSPKPAEPKPNTKPAYGKPRTQDSTKKDGFRCYNCQQPGHLARDCPQSSVKRTPVLNISQVEECESDSGSEKA